MKEYFNFLGFKINTKKFLITIAVLAAVVLALAVVDLLIAEVSWYGFLIGCAFVLAVVIACELMPHRGLRVDLPYDLIWWIFPFSIIGARIAFVANNIHLYDTFWEMCEVWNGGLSIYGGVMGGIIGLCICCLIKRVNPICATDCVAPVLILGQAIGRWGNFANMEVYGWEITNEALKWFPFGVNIKGTWHLATFFYESVLDFVGFIGLLYLLRKSNKKGITTFAYFTYYGFIRFFLEQLRDPKFIMVIPGTSVEWSTLTSIITFVVGVAGLVTIFVMDYIKKSKTKAFAGVKNVSLENVSKTEKESSKEKSVSKQSNMENIDNADTKQSDNKKSE